MSKETKVKKTEPKKQGATKTLTRQMRRRVLVVMVVLVILCSGGVTAQLFSLQILQSEYLQRGAVTQQLSDITISPNRGQIFDANMSILALTREVCTVIMSPKNIPDEETREMIVEELGTLLDVDREKLREQASDSASQYKVVKAKIDKSLGDTFIDWVEEKKLGAVFRVITDYKREYPMNNLLSSVLGFVGADNLAKEGLEVKYDEVLSGTPGRLVTALNAWGDELPTRLPYENTVDAEDGYSLVLTVDQTIQQITEKYLEEAINQYAAKNRGAAIVMDVQTGAILAMATKKDYNPNDYLTIADPDVAAQIAQLSGDEQSAALVKARNEQYRNKAVSDFYEPGSVFKTVTASIGLEEGIVSEDSRFTCQGYYTLPGVKPMRCHVYPQNHGNQNFVQAIANSCNPVFMTLGNQIGAHLFFKYYTGFGFTQRTGIDLLGEPLVTPGLYHDEKDIKPVDLATSSIGQTFKVTPLQMVTALAAIANGGYLMQPYMVQQVLDSNGNVVSNTEPAVKRQVISADTSKRMAAMLENAVSGGAIKNAYVSGYRVAGKTGTSEKTEMKDENDPTGKDVEVVASFGGFAPADNPRVAVLVMVDEPNKKSGGAVAAPVAKKILESILPYLGIEPRYTEKELAELNRTVPRVTSMTTAEAVNSLKTKSLKSQVVGEGVTVIRQIPESGSSIPKDGTVWLYTDETPTVTTTVPDFREKTVAQVNQSASSAGINVQLSGITAGDGEPKSLRQSVAPGSKVPKGTVVNVEFIYEDTVH